MLVVLSPGKSWEVLGALSPVLRHEHDLEVKVVSNPYEVLALTGVKAVLALGGPVLEYLQAEGVAPKNRKITGLRRQVLIWNGLKTLVSYSPGISEVNSGWFVDLLTDAGLAVRLAKTGQVAPAFGDYQYVPDLSTVVAGIKHELESRKYVDMGFDTETLGLDRHDPDGYIIGIQVSYKPGHARMVAFPNKEASREWLHAFENQQDLGWLLNHKRIRTCMANGKYDIEWVFEQSGIECSNFTFDTTMVGSLLDENRSNALDVHAKIYVPALGGYSDEFDRKANKARMDLEYAKDPAAFLQYSGGDADATLQVKAGQKEALVADPELARFYVTIMHPSLRAFEQVERGGVLVDLDAYKELEADLRTEMLGKVAQAKKHLGGLLVAKHWDANKPGGLNLTKASLLTDFLFTKEGLNLRPTVFTEKSDPADPTPSTALETLLAFKDHPTAGPFIALLEGFGSASKMLSTYVTGFQKHIRADGRFHPTYWLFAGDKGEDEGGTNTGRPSCRDPAFQTIPKYNIWAKAIRRCFPAPPGYLILETDYSQGELKVVACVANEQTMLSSYALGLDLHVVTGGNIGGYTYEEMLALKISDPEVFDQLRQQAKAGNFGLLYGMGAAGFKAYAYANYGVTLSMAQAEEIRDMFFKTYPGLVAYHEAYKAFARTNGYVRSPLGRVRHLPLAQSRLRNVRSGAERQAINSPIQGCLSDMMIWSVALEVERGWHLEAPCFGTVHDASYRYILEDNHVLYVKRTVEVMENLPFEQVGWAPQLKFTADAKVGRNMGDLMSLEKWAKQA